MQIVVLEDDRIVQIVDRIQLGVTKNPRSEMNKLLNTNNPLKRTRESIHSNHQKLQTDLQSVTRIIDSASFQ